MFLKIVVRYYFFIFYNTKKHGINLIEVFKIYNATFRHTLKLFFYFLLKFEFER